MSIASLYPSINPSLLLDFANSKVLDSRVTFTRTTTATYYDGVTTAKAEENLLTYSQAFDNAAWSQRSVTVSANSTTAPDGTSTADTITPQTNNDYHYIYLASTPSGATNTCLSVYAKTNGYNNFFIRSNTGGTYRGVNFNISTGVVNAVENGASGTITSVGNGWYRCSVIFTGYTLSSQTQFLVAPDATGNADTQWVGNGTSGIYLWGAQLEQRSSATAYTATTSQAITNYIPVLQTAAAGQARFDHNPTTGESLGLLIEEARTNICLQSEDFSTTWTNQESTEEVNVAIAPSGTLTADKLIPTTANDSHWISQSVTPTAAAHTFSFYAKAAGYSIVQVLNGTDATDRINFDLSNGTVGSATTYTGTITAVGNGWYRCTATYTTSATTSAWARIAIVPSSTSARAAAFAGNGFSGVFLWGAQFELGAFATSYIPTVASSVTRNADAASMTGTNFSSWFGNGEGTVYTEFAKFGVKTYGYLYSISNGATNEEISLNFDSAGTILYARIYSGGGYQVQATLTSSVTDNVFYRNSFGFEVNNSAASWNAGAVVTDSVCTIPNCNALVLAASATGSDIQSCRIKKFAFYPQRVSNTNLVALTT